MLNVNPARKRTGKMLSWSITFIDENGETKTVNVSAPTIMRAIYWSKARGRRILTASCHAQPQFTD